MQTQKLPNYEKSYWKAIEIQERVEQGKIKFCERDVQRVIDLMRLIADVAFKEA